MNNKLTAKEREVYNTLKDTDHFKRYLNFMVTTSCLSKKTKREQMSETLDFLKSCARIIVRNPNIEPAKIYGWWFGEKGYRKPRNLILE